MANSVHKSYQGPLWPIGSVAVATPGTPVNMMINVDATLSGDPGVIAGIGLGVPEYTVRAQQIIIGGFKVSGSSFANNSGNIYVILKGNGTNNRTDSGCIVLIVPAGSTGVIASAPLNRNVFDPYLLWIDADNAGDSAQITLVIQ